MRELQLDHVPYFCSFASGCAGFMSVLIAAAGLFRSPDERAGNLRDGRRMPPGVPYNMLRERILDPITAPLFGSGVSTWLSIARDQLLLHDANCVSIRRDRETNCADDTGACHCLGLDLAGSDVAVHYPNIFPELGRW